MKRTLSFFLVCALTAASLACGDSTSSNPPITPNSNSSPTPTPTPNPTPTPSPIPPPPAPPPGPVIPQIKLTAQITGIGKGQVTTSDQLMQCRQDGGTCEVSMDINTSVQLKAEPDAGYVFLGWYDDNCRSKNPICTLSLNEAKTVKAAFVKLAFTTNADPSMALSQDLPGNTRNLWLMKTDGTELTAITQLKQAAGPSSPVWSPDGTKLIYSSYRSLKKEEDLSGQASNIWIVEVANPANTKPLTQLTGIGIIADQPSFSPDGTHIVYLSNRNLTVTDLTNANLSKNLWLTTEAGDIHLPITDLNLMNAYCDGAKFSPDGSQIAYFSNRSLDPNQPNQVSPTFNVWTLSTKDFKTTEAVTQLKNVSAWSPLLWSADSKQLIYHSNRSFTAGYPDQDDFYGNAWAVQLDAKTHRPLTQVSIANATAISLSPDGSQIVYVSDRSLASGFPANQQNKDSQGNTVGNLWLTSLQTPSDTPLTTWSGLQVNSFSPLWSDPKTIFFISNRLPEKDEAINSSQRRPKQNNLWKLDLVDTKTFNASALTTTLQLSFYEYGTAGF